MRMMMLAIAGLLPAGCTRFVATVDIDALPPDQQSEIRSIRIIDDEELTGGPIDFVFLGAVRGMSCQKNPSDPPATAPLAIEQAKYYAWKLKADGIACLHFGDGMVSDASDYSDVPDCWNWITVTAEAVRCPVGPPSPGWR